MKYKDNRTWIIKMNKGGKKKEEDRRADGKRKREMGGVLHGWGRVKGGREAIGRGVGRGRQGEEGTRHLVEARALVSGGCSCSASVLDSALAAAFKFSHRALTSSCHRTKNMARCTRANISRRLMGSF